LSFYFKKTEHGFDGLPVFAPLVVRTSRRLVLVPELSRSKGKNRRRHDALLRGMPSTFQWGSISRRDRIARLRERLAPTGVNQFWPNLLAMLAFTTVLLSQGANFE
jgi:hypothetical protein